MDNLYIANFLYMHIYEFLLCAKLSWTFLNWLSVSLFVYFNKHLLVFTLLNNVCVLTSIWLICCNKVVTTKTFFVEKHYILCLSVHGNPDSFQMAPVKAKYFSRFVIFLFLVNKIFPFRFEHWVLHFQKNHDF